jgi:site-specific recombinase XerD
VRLILADRSLVVQGRSFEGLPLLVNSDGTSVEPAQTFLWEVLATSGRARSPLTWAKYGRDLYDYLAFLDANDLDWRAHAPAGMPSSIDWYRDWSRAEAGLNVTTINARLRLVVRFYEWAVKRGYIDAVPFQSTTVRTGRQPGFLAHVDASDGRMRSPCHLLPQPRSVIKFLTIEQARLCLRELSNTTHRLMFELMIRCGLRQVECRTFPLAYVFDPTRRRDLPSGAMIRVALDAGEMKLKYDQPRAIDVPYALMQDLWAYAVRHRQRRERSRDTDNRQRALFLTEAGEVYGDTALTDVFSGLSRRVGFRVRPHMLRHSYGTYALMRLRKHGFKGEPLLYVRDRMGHSSVATTSVYLHLINQLDAHLVLLHEDELDTMFAVEGR